jgi:hypothetical protein
VAKYITFNQFHTPVVLNTTGKVNYNLINYNRFAATAIAAKQKKNDYGI